MARYDDGKRGFGVSDALSLSEAWQQVQMMLSTGQLQFPKGEPPAQMLAFFKAAYPPEKFEAALQYQLEKDVAEQTLIDAIESGLLPLWVAPLDGPFPERLVAAGSLIEFGRESLIAGCYRPYNDTDSLVYGYPLFVKRRDWTSLLAAQTAGPPPLPLVEQLTEKARKKPGPLRDPDWPSAISKVTQECIDAGYLRPLKRGEKSAIQVMLLDEMAKKGTYFSEDTARNYAKEVIASLPE